MPIPTEPIGSIPRPKALIEEIGLFATGRLPKEQLDRLYETALADTIKLFEATGSPVITDGEQTKPSFDTYPIHGLKTLSANGVTIPFADGHTRQLPVITAGPFQYQTYADVYLEAARQYTAASQISGHFGVCLEPSLPDARHPRLFAGRLCERSSSRA
jgi:5-methyltetrahydropteroyltriglutamate--homocysteine methyltransferase